jgi:endogenous inhibitor of DNA gyrase (YacG/DUF329 family)
MTGNAMTQAPGAKQMTSRPCPICSRPEADLYSPFCSRRCADVDLGRWLKGSYAIPIDQNDEEDERQELPEDGEAASAPIARPRPSR